MPANEKENPIELRLLSSQAIVLVPKRLAKLMQQAQRLGDMGVAPLFEPRVTHLLGDEIRFLGYEQYGRAWVVQEWWCRIGGTQPRWSP